MRIGELSRELDKDEHRLAGKDKSGKPVRQSTAGLPEQTKAATLKAAGISHAAAMRAEQLAEPEAKKRVEKYIAEQAAGDAAIGAFEAGPLVPFSTLVSRTPRL